MNRQPGGDKNARQPASSPPLSRYETVIGLEVHCQLSCKSKLFCSCSTAFGALPNHHTCPTCLGYPGSLPVLNKQAVDYAVKFALAVNARISEQSIFARKQYFYPDLPKGYQISQFDQPYCQNGIIRLNSGKEIRIMRAHLEEDAGKNIHGEGASYVDLNRAGIPLVEIVTMPDLSTAEEAVEYLKKLRAIVRYLEISDGNLEEGSFRCDANVSIRPRGQKELGTRCEIKNLNSFKSIERAIDYEILRQSDLADSGTKLLQQTLLYDAALGKTKPMRSKEDSPDYRYFPDPDLRPITISQARIKTLAATLPELPHARAERFVKELSLNEYDSAVLTLEQDIANYFETVLAKVGNAVAPKIVANWIAGDFLHAMHEGDWDVKNPKISVAQFSELMVLLGKQVISGKIAKKVFDEMVATGKGAQEIVDSQGLVQVLDVDAITKTAAQVLAANPKQIDEFLGGKEKVLGFFIGQIMKISAGKFNPDVVNKVLREMLNERKSQK